MFDPALTDHLFLLVTSKVLDGGGQEFVEEFSSGFGYDPVSCAADYANLSVDGAVGRLVTHCREQGEFFAVVATGDRGYVITAYGIEDLGWFRSVLATVEIGDVATAFERPFRYARPAGTAITDQTRTRYAFSQGTVRVYPDAGWKPFPGAHGITVWYGTDIRTHTNSYARRPLRPTAFLADLRVNTMLTVGPITSTSVAGLPASQADVRFNGDIGASSGYPYIEIGVEGGIDLEFPSRLLIVPVDAGVIAVQLWAGTDEEQAAWLPRALVFVDSLEFV